MKGLNTDEAIVVDGVRLICTCSAAPEQYDAFSGDRLIGYLRLRHGNFTVTYPDVGGDLVYEGTPEGDGCFEDHERKQFLKQAVRALLLRDGAG